MVAIKVKKNFWLKPRFCADCGRFAIKARHFKSERCVKCSIHRNRKLRKERNKVEFGNTKGKYGRGYTSRRKKCIAQGYCSLCGSMEHLTAHHVGGGTDYEKLTCLCDTCHQAYECWNNKKKARA